MKDMEPIYFGRRGFLAGAAVAPWALRATGASAAEPLQLRFRQVHLDFHTSQHVKGIAVDFDPQAFAASLKKAHVDSVTVFARCHHGYLYYDSKKFAARKHPHLSRNLLKEQIEACHKQGIRAPIYSTIMWDQYTVDQHPDWRQVTAKGELHGPPPFEPGFYRQLCLNSPYVADFLKPHIEELFSLVPVDGLFLDIVKAQDCSCEHCLRDMAKKGINASVAEARQEFGRQVTDRFKREMSASIRKLNRDATIFYNGGHVGPHFRSTVDTYSHLELESLPSGGWGYLHFPLTIRYARTLGLDSLGMTGKFHTSWGDFHSLKNKAALEFECFQMLAMGAKCSVGDQLHPTGKLDGATYDLIGGVYAQVEMKEPWCKGARALVDIGVVSPEEFDKAGARTPPSARGVVRMLQEAAQQFDVIDSVTDFGRYKVLVLPDEIPVKGKLEQKLVDYVRKGGAVIGSYKSSSEKLFGAKVKGDAPFSPDYIRARQPLAKGLANTELVMYLKGLELVPSAGTEVLADVLAPYFNRTWDHFFSHKHTPSSGKVAYPGVVRRGRTIAFAHPIFTQYAKNAPRWCKTLFMNALDLVLPQPLLRLQAPSSALSALNEQPSDKRWVLHLLHYVPERRGDDFDIIEDVIPIHAVGVSVRTPRAPAEVALVPEGKPLTFEFKTGRTEFTVPKVEGHQMVAIKI